MRLGALLLFGFAFSSLAQAQLNFNGGTVTSTVNFGTLGFGVNTLYFTPAGGTAPYVFDQPSGAVAISGFRVSNAPDIPNNPPAGATAAFLGLATVPGVYTTTVRLTDSTTATVTKTVTFTVTAVDFLGIVPTNFGVGDTVSWPLTGVGGTPPYSFALAPGSGPLPGGLAINSSGSITGMLTTSGSTNFRVRVTDSSSPNPLTFDRTFTPFISPLKLVTTSMPMARVLPTAPLNLIYSYQIAVNGCSGSCTFSLAAGDTVPAGLNLGSSGLVSGTPTSVVYEQHFSVVVTDTASNTVTYRMSLSVVPPTPTPLTISNQTFHDISVGQDTNSNGIYGFGGYPPYTVTLDASSPALPAGLSMFNGSALDLFFDPDAGLIRGKTLTAGPYNAVIRFTDAQGNFTTRQFTFNASNLFLFYSSLPANLGPDVVLGVPYSEQTVPIGGTPPYAIVQNGLNVAGINIDNSGHVSGTPLEVGRFLPFSLGITDSSAVRNTYSNNCCISVDPPAGNTTLAINAGDIGFLQEGNAFARNVVITGSALANPTFAVSVIGGSLPPGLALLTGSNFNNGGANTAGAQIAGIPNTSGTYSFIIGATDGAGGIGQREYIIHVSNLALVETTMAPGTVGQFYSQTFTPRGGSGPYTFTVNTGSLPSGLNQDPATGTISGMPATQVANTIGIQVMDSLGSVFVRNYALNIYSLQITTPNVLPNVIQGRAYSQALTITPGGSYSWSATGLPGGLNINASTGVISGTVTSTATTTVNVTVTAANSATAVVKTFTMFVTNLGVSNLVTGLPTAPLGDLVVGQQANTVFAPLGGTPPYTVSLEPASTLPPGLTIGLVTQVSPTTNFGRYSLQGIPTTAGNYSFRLRFTDAAGVFAVRTVSVNVSPIGLVTATPGIATVNQSYSAQLQAVGAAGPFTFTVAPLLLNIMPPGLGLSSSGLITGIPTTTSAFVTTIDITGNGFTRRQAIQTTIDSSGTQRIDFGAASPFFTDVASGTNFSTLLTPVGGAGTHTWSLVSGALPPGLQGLTGNSLPPGFTPPSAILTGVPTTPGNYTFRIRVDDSTGNFGIRDFFLNVTPLRNGPSNQPYTFTGFTTPLRVGVPYSFGLQMGNGAPPVTFANLAGTFLPTGISMASTGVVAGTPGEAGNFLQAFLATDANGATRLAPGRGFISYPATGPLGVDGLTSATLGDASVGIAYAFNLNDLLLPGLGVGPFVWTLDSGSVPPGLGFSGSVLSGTPTATGSYTFTVLVTDSQGTQHIVPALILNVGTLNISPPPGALPNAVVGSAYSATLTAAGGPGPITFRPSFISDMPVGLSLSSTGVLSGTPTTQGPFSLWIEAVDNASNVVRQRYTLTVGPPGAPIPEISVAPTNVSVNYTTGNPAPSPIPMNVLSTAAAFPFTASTSGGTWLSVSPGSGSTPGTVNAIFDVTGLGAGTYNGAITIISASASNSPQVVPVSLTVAAPAVCSFVLNPGSSTVSATGGGTSFNVNTQPGCDWTATTSDAWITVNTPSGSGTGPVSINAAANGGSTARVGSVTVQGLVFSLTQFGSSCSFTISPTSLTVGAALSTGPITINSSAAGCSWSATPVDSFLTVSAPSSGTGSGSVTVNVAANAGGATRTGTATIAGQTLAVTQGGVGCVYSLSGSSASPPSSGGTLPPISVTAPGGCSWTTDSGPSWVQIASGGSATGPGSVQLSISPNSSSATRTTNVLIAGLSYSISQAGSPCSFSISSSNPVQTSGGGSTSVTVTPSGPSCSWIASSPVSWLTPTAPSGTGAGSVSFSVSPNGNPSARNATVTVADQSIIVNQDGSTCSYSLQSPSANVPSLGGPGAVGVIAASGCGWMASSPVSWVQITSNSSSSGNASVGYNVDPNATGVPRSTTLTVAGNSFPVTQVAASCVITIGPPTSFNAGEFGGSSSFGYVTSVSSCSHTVLSFSSWITITSNPYAGTVGSVNFTVDPNTFSLARSGIIRVGDQEFTVTQNASTCTYTLTAYGMNFSQGGGTDAVPMTFSPAACGPPAVAINGPIGMITLGSAVAAPGTYSQNYLVSPYLSFINYVRTAQLLVQGQPFTVKQTSD